MGPCPVKFSYLRPSLFVSAHFSFFLCLSGLFFTFPCSWLAVHLSWLLPIITSLFLIPTLIFFLLASFTDPGTLCKGMEESANQSFTGGPPEYHWYDKYQVHHLLSTVYCSWCKSCVEPLVFRSPLPLEVKTVGTVCHCEWINNCVTVRNIRSFVLFVAFMGVYSWSVMIYCLFYLGLTLKQPFGVEKACTLIVTTGIAFYMLPLYTLNIPNVDKIRAARIGHTPKAARSEWKPFRSHQAWWQPSTWHLQLGTEYREESAMPNAKTQEAFVIVDIPPVSSFTVTAPGSSPHSCPPDVPVKRKGATVWNGVLAALQSVLPRKGPMPETSTQQASPKAGLKKSGRPLNTAGRNSTELPPSELQLLDEDQDICWKCQLFVDRRPPSSPTGTHLSLFNI